MNGLLNLKSEISNFKFVLFSVPLCLCGSIFISAAAAAEFQPLAANARRLLEGLNSFGVPVDDQRRARIDDALETMNVVALERELDGLAAIVLTLQESGGIKPGLGLAPIVLQQRGYMPVVVKVVPPKGNLTHLPPIYVSSSQARPVYGGEAENSLTRQGRLDLKSDLGTRSDPERMLMVEWSTRLRGGPLGDALEYQILLIYAHVAGDFEAKLEFGRPETFEEGARPKDVAGITVPCSARPAVKVKLRIRDFDGAPSTGKFVFRDSLNHVYPPQPKRLAPDFFFQEQIYRHDGDVVLLPPGDLKVEYSRGPEYKTRSTVVTIPDREEHKLAFELQRWINPLERGFYSGDHHIHGAGCAHYTAPTEGVTPADMFLQIKGEGLNVGSVLTWGPCYEHQRQYFSAQADPLSEPFTVLKYDVEVSGFGSHRLGHTCLLNLRDQTYPGSDGTKTKGWPTWTTPVLRWTKQQGGFTGYPHSASGLAIDPKQQSSRLILALDLNGDNQLTVAEAGRALLPEPVHAIDVDRDSFLSQTEMVLSHNRAADSLPNYAIPEMNGVGAMEICVSAAHGVCDFISAMDTERIQEWNTWYHLLNCGLPVACAGETDFPCMSSTRVGQGRTYVRLGKIERLDYAEWCRGLAEGRSYVSDGYAHALDFAVEGRRYGEDLKLDESGDVTVTAEVAFAAGTPRGVPYGDIPVEGLRAVGDTRILYSGNIRSQPSERWVEVIVNGEAVTRRRVPADDAVHKLTFQVPISQSSWVAVRQFPQLHTNPIRVLVGGRPIRASRRSAEWCLGVIDQLWRSRSNVIAAAEVDEAKKAFEEAKEFYRRVAKESTTAKLR